MRKLSPCKNNFNRAKRARSPPDKSPTSLNTSSPLNRNDPNTLRAFSSVKL